MKSVRLQHPRRTCHHLSLLFNRQCGDKFPSLFQSCIPTSATNGSGRWIHGWAAAILAVIDTELSHCSDSTDNEKPKSKHAFCTAEHSGGNRGVLFADGVVPALIQLDDVQNKVNVIPRVRANCARTIPQNFIGSASRNYREAGAVHPMIHNTVAWMTINAMSDGESHPGRYSHAVALAGVTFRC